MPRAATVIGVLTPEAPHREVVEMVDDGVRRIGELASRVTPAEAEVAVLGRRQRKARVEAAKRLERRPVAGHVVRREERRLAT